MNINEIESVCAVDFYKNYSEAAFHMNLSPAVVSKHVAKVEEELGLKIFERASKSRPVSLTKQGEAVLPLLHSICNSYTRIKTYAANEQNNTVQMLRIGYAPLIGGFGESDIISRFLLNNPNMQITRTVASNKNLINMLKQGALDAVFLPVMGYYENGVYISANSIGDPDIVSVHLFTHKGLRIGLSRNHRFAEEKIITREMFISLCDETFMFSSAQADTFGSKQRNNITAELGINKDIKMRFVDYTEPKLPLNLIASGAVIMPNSCMDVIESRDVVFIPVEGWKTTVDLLFIYRKDNFNSSLKKLLEESRSFAASKNIL